jgi:branched-chain amino acid transport system permease protein
MDLVSHLETFLQLLVSGLIIGCNYGLMCVGLGLIFGVMRVINFAQGDFMTLGMYFALFFVAGLAGLGFGAFQLAMIGALVAGIVFYGVGQGIHRGLISRVTGLRVAGLEDGGHTAQLILTLGLSLVIQNAGLMLFGSTPTSIRSPLSSTAWEIGPLVGDEVFLFLNQARTWSALLAVAIAVLLTMAMSRTALGRRLRAAADNPTAALYVGIDVAKAHRIAFGLGVALTTVAGATVATYLPFQPYTGLEFVVIMYAGVVLGGMGSVGGAFWGGLIIGLVQQLSTMVLPVQLQTTAIFCIFLAILLFRPQGLFGRNAERA